MLRFGLVLGLSLSALSVANKCWAAEYPTEWNGMLGQDHIDVSFVSNPYGKPSLRINTLSRDRLLCDKTETTYSGALRPANGNALYVDLELPNGSRTGVLLKQSSVTLGGIPYIQLAGNVKENGRQMPLVIRGIVGTQYRNKLYNCTASEVVEFQPGLLRVLIKPSLQASFEKAMDGAGLKWRRIGKGSDGLFEDDFAPENLMEIAGIREGEENVIGNQMLRQDSILDVRRVERPRNEKAPSGWVGQLGNDRVVVEGSHRLEPADCASSSDGGLPLYLHLEDVNTYTLVIADKSDRTVELHPKRYFTIERGIPIESIETSEFNIDGRKSKLALRRPLAGFVLWLSRCNEVGYDPEILQVAVYPDSDQMARDYFTQRQLRWSNQAQGVQDSRNLYTLRVTRGTEIDELLELRKQPWVVDSWQQAAGAGLPPVPIYFTPHSIYRTLKEDQENLRVKLRNALQEVFVKLPLDDSMVAIDGQGLNYVFSVEAPMELLGNTGFKGFWIKTKVSFQFSRVMNSDNEADIHDTMFVGIPDGWLARWPSPTKPPPDGHYDHLSPKGSDRTKNFDSMTWLQRAIIAHLRVKWSGVE